MSDKAVEVELDDDVRETLERDAAEQGISLGSYLGNLAAERGRSIRKAEIREQSRIVGQLVRENDDARNFYETWGTPSADS